MKDKDKKKALKDFFDRVEAEIKKIGGTPPKSPDVEGTNEELNASISVWWPKACVALQLHKSVADETDRIQSIGNLALLSGTLNTRLSNRMFSGKQTLIKQADKAHEYIPLCTHNAFLKYYSIAKEEKTASKDISLMLWTLEDIENHENEILQTLDAYLPATMKKTKGAADEG